MPESYKKPRWRHRPEWGLSHAAELGRLLKIVCRRCKRTRYFLASDLLEVFGDYEVDDVRPTCPTCGTDAYIVVDLHAPARGDWGKLPVRRPTAPIQIIKWRTVKLGDP